MHEYTCRGWNHEDILSRASGNTMRAMQNEGHHVRASGSRKGHRREMNWSQAGICVPAHGLRVATLLQVCDRLHCVCGQILASLPPHLHMGTKHRIWG